VSETVYVRVRREVKERLEKLARERGVYLVDVASEALERGLGMVSTAARRSASPTMAERLIGVWRLKTCRFLGEDGYCKAWQLPKDEAERIYGGEAKELLELRTVERSTWLGVEKIEEYGLKPTPSLCFHCPFFERR
jgi:hypothetical protein